MKASVPVVAITSDAHCVIEVNGIQLGECERGGWIALPVSSEGDYYISAIPLEAVKGRFLYSVTRRVSFKDGQIMLPLAGDVALTKWDDETAEIALTCGSISGEAIHPFPTTIGRIRLAERGVSREIILYYDNGLRCFAEEGGRYVNGLSFGNYTDGTIFGFENDGIQLCAVRIMNNDKQRLVVFDVSMKVLLDVVGDVVSVERGIPTVIDKIGVALGREKRVRYALRDGAFAADTEERGFFTHDELPISDTLTLGMAFCEAVRNGWREEAMSYLCEELAGETDYALVEELMGKYESVRTPPSDRSGERIGLINGKNGVLTARTMHFEYDKMRITNISDTE